MKEDFKWKQFLEWVKVLVTQSCPILCHSMDYSSPGSSVHGILQARIWSGLPFPSPEDLPNPEIEPAPPTLYCIIGGFFTIEPICSEAMNKK